MANIVAQRILPFITGGVKVIIYGLRLTENGACRIGGLRIGIADYRRGCSRGLVFRRLGIGSEGNANCGSRLETMSNLLPIIRNPKSAIRDWPVIPDDVRQWVSWPSEA